MRREVKHVVSVSGGKDSTATLLLALNRFPRARVIPIFCDTGNEHDAVHEYLSYLEQALDISIVRLRANFDAEIARKRTFVARDQRMGRDKRGKKLRWSNKAKRRALSVLRPSGNPFLDLCLWKGRFPSRKAQFCTERLKRDIAVMYQIELIDAGHLVVGWQGVRRDESEARKSAKKFERIGPRLYVYRPIVDWSAEDVFAYCAERKIQPNPLYMQGMRRVGCMPCINVRKDELAQIGSRFPEHIDRIDKWERLVSAAAKRGYSTMMSDSHGAEDPRVIYRDLNIRSRVDWAKTTRGGCQYSLFAEPSDIGACSSAYGLCE